MRQPFGKLLILTALISSSVPLANVFAQGGYGGNNPAPSPTTTSSPGTTNQYSYNSKQSPYGECLGDYQGKSVYAYAGDQAGSGASNCYGACAQAWPPVTVPSGQTPTASGNAQQQYLGTISRTDGKTQVTYKGNPLYYYAEDQNQNDYKGQKLDQYGALWYLVKPDGNYLQ
jgi:predicted lipoprotein with Yx(FWY)xxD motif